MPNSRKGDTQRVATYSLLLSLHRYAKWVSSLRSAKPASLSAAERDIRLIVALRDEHFHGISSQVDELKQEHYELQKALAARSPSCLARSTGQAEVVNRLTSTVERFLQAAPS